MYRSLEQVILNIAVYSFGMSNFEQQYKKYVQERVENDNLEIEENFSFLLPRMNSTINKCK